MFCDVLRICQWVFAGLCFWTLICQWVLWARCNECVIPLRTMNVPLALLRRPPHLIPWLYFGYPLQSEVGRTKDPNTSPGNTWLDPKSNIALCLSHAASTAQQTCLTSIWMCPKLFKHGQIVSNSCMMLHALGISWLPNRGRGERFRDIAACLEFSVHWFPYCHWFLWNPLRGGT